VVDDRCQHGLSKALSCSPHRRPGRRKAGRSEEVLRRDKRCLCQHQHGAVCCGLPAAERLLHVLTFTNLRGGGEAIISNAMNSVAGGNASTSRIDDAAEQADEIGMQCTVESDAWGQYSRRKWNGVWRRLRSKRSRMHLLQYALASDT
jgi:hypothetical protein